MEMTNEDKKNFVDALDQFKSAVGNLAVVWSSNAYDGTEVENYPESLPSFDEFALQVADMQFRGFNWAPSEAEVRPAQLVKVGMRIIPQSHKRAWWCKHGTTPAEPFDWFNTSDSAVVRDVSYGPATSCIIAQLDDGRKLLTSFGNLAEVVGA